MNILAEQKKHAPNEDAKFSVGRMVVALFAISLVAKIVLAWLVPPATDETYYWSWTQFLSLSYFDHPGMIAWILKPFAHLAPSPFFRLPVVFMGQATFGLMLYLVRERFSRQQLLQLSLLICLSPVLGVGSILATPDVPYLFFWVAALVFLRRVFVAHLWRDYLLLGAALGLGFCAKYHMVIFLPILFVFLISEKRYRVLKLPRVFASVFVGLVCSLPVFVWNSQNHWASFLFQIDHGLASPHFEWRWSQEYLLGQILLMFPSVFWLGMRRPRAGDFIESLLWYFAWGPLLFFLVSSFRAPTQMNWPLAALPLFFALACLRMKSPKTLWGHHIIWSGFYVYVAVALGSHHPEWLPGKLLDPVYFRDAVQAAKGIPSPTFAGSYQMASQIWFYNGQPTYKLAEASRIDHFDYLPLSKPTQPEFHVIMDRADSLPDWLREQNYQCLSSRVVSNHFEIFTCRR
jgi:4-amino-4-deoxy-L-arabinose transferase-like glycosyltransferase